MCLEELHRVDTGNDVLCFVSSGAILPEPVIGNEWRTYENDQNL